MKKIFSILLTLILIACLMGCDNNENITQSDKDADIRIWTDVETGVQYVVYSHSGGYSGMGGITPRLNADGTLYHPTEKGGAE